MGGHVPDDPIARLIRATIEADAAAVDVVSLESGICERLAQRGGEYALPSTSSFPSLWRRPALRMGLAAACLCLMLGTGGYLLLSASAVQAYDLVVSARAALGTAADREYIVSFTDADALPILSSLDEARVWTRGDRYRVQFVRGNRQILWGQDETRRLWLVANAEKGLSFQSQEVPREIAAFLQYLSLDLKDLTDQILHNCELTFSEGFRNQRKGVKTVKAVPKPTGRLVEFSAAQIEIDESTKAIRRLSLTRRVNGRDGGSCQFLLVSEASQPDESYRLDTYLAAGAVVLDQSKYYDRMVELFRVIREFPKK